METSITGIIEKIKKEGVEKAGQEAEKLIVAAKEERDQLLRNAKKQGEDIIAKAGNDAAQLKANSEAVLRQAARDVVLGLRGAIMALFDSIVKKEVGAVLEPRIVQKMLGLLAEKFDAGEHGEIEAVLSAQDKEELEKLFTAELKKEMLSGVALSSSKEISKGFRIGKKDSGVYYDFTDEAIGEALNAYLNKGLLAILFGEKNNG